MSELKLLSGKTEIRRLNNHEVVVLVPRSSISYEEGVKELEKLVDKIKKKRE